MKKVLYAWIEQILQFDSVKELTSFVENTEGTVSIRNWEEDGKWMLHCKRPYNKNPML